MSTQSIENSFLKCLPENFDRSRENSPRDKVSDHSADSSDDCIFGSLDGKRKITRPQISQPSLRDFIVNEAPRNPPPLTNRQVTVLNNPKPVDLKSEPKKTTETTIPKDSQRSNLNTKIDQDWWREATAWIKITKDSEEFKRRIRNPMPGVPTDNIPTWGKKTS